MHPKAIALSGKLRDSWKKGLGTSWPAVLLISCAVGALNGLSFGGQHDNHPTYVPPGLRLIDPQYLASDWWATQVTHYHHRFSLLVAGLARVGMLEWGLAIGNVITIAAMCMLFFQYLRRQVPENSLAAWLMAILLIFIAPQILTTGSAYLVSFSLQPSTVGMFGYVAAIFAFLAGRYYSSGAALLLSGAFHANFLLLSFPTFGLAHLLLGRRYLGRRLAAQLLPCFVLLLLELPTILRIAGTDLSPELRAEATSIFLKNLSFHYLPLLSEYVPLMGYSIVSLAALRTMIRHDAQKWRSFSTISTSLLICIWGAALVGNVFGVIPIVRLYVWRLGPVLVLLTQIAIAILVVDAWGKRQLQPNRLPHSTRVMFVLGWSFLVVSYLLPAEVYPRYCNRWLGLTVVISTGALWILGRLFERDRHLYPQIPARSRAPVVIASIMLVTATLVNFEPLHYDLVTKKPPMDETDSDMNLYTWLLEETPEQSTIMVYPFGIEGIRLFGQRAIIVDYKAVPHRPDEMIEWYGRLIDVKDAYESGDFEDVIHRYRPDYVVTKDIEAQLGPLVYKNRDYAVFEIELNKQ